MTELSRSAYRARAKAVPTSRFSRLELSVVTVVGAMALHLILARLDALNTGTSSMVWITLGFLAATVERDQPTVMHSLMIAAFAGGVMALFLTAAGTAPTDNHSSIVPTALLFAETICRTVLCFAAAVAGCLVSAGIGASPMEAPFAGRALTRRWN